MTSQTFSPSGNFALAFTLALMAFSCVALAAQTSVEVATSSGTLKSNVRFKVTK